MENAVFRAAAVYIFLLILFRFMGKRSLSQATTFDFILLLIISEATQNAMIGDDFSLTNSFIVISTLVGLDIFLNKIKDRWQWFDKVTESVPLVLMSGGAVHRSRLKEANVNEDELLEAARRQYGFTSLRRVRYAVLEIDGTITIIPKQRRMGSRSDETGTDAQPS